MADPTSLQYLLKDNVMGVDLGKPPQLFDAAMLFGAHTQAAKEWA